MSSVNEMQLQVLALFKSLVPSIDNDYYVDGKTRKVARCGRAD